jgi:uncharacterized membrane protein YbaN (DUF454 family)
MRDTDAVTPRRLPYLCLAYGCVAIGAAGIVLPLVPTTPFLLIAAWAAPKGSPRLAAWLDRHPRFGPPLQAWREQGAVPARAKRLACVLLLASWGMLLATASSVWVAVGAAPLLLAVAIYVCTRPLPKGSCPPQPYR